MKQKNLKGLVFLFFVIAILLIIYNIYDYHRDMLQDNYYASSMLNTEWIKLSDYKGEYEQYFGHNPGKISCAMYEMSGLSRDEYLYAEDQSLFSYDEQIDTYMMMNMSVKEPVKRFPIKTIKIMREGKNTVRIVDANALNAISTLLVNDIRTESELDWIEDNSIVEFDIECELMWFCRFEVTDEGRVILLGRDEKNNKYYEYDLTDIFESYAITLK